MKNNILVIAVILIGGYIYLQNNPDFGRDRGHVGQSRLSATSVLVEEDNGFLRSEMTPISYEDMEREFENMLEAYNDFLLDDHYNTYGNERQIFRDRQRFLKRYLPLMKNKFFRERENGTLEERRRRPKSGLFE